MGLAANMFSHISRMKQLLKFCSGLLLIDDAKDEQKIRWEWQNASLLVLMNVYQNTAPFVRRIFFAACFLAADKQVGKVQKEIWTSARARLRYLNFIDKTNVVNRRAGMEMQNHAIKRAEASEKSGTLRRAHVTKFSILKINATDGVVR
jgi:hypothetical protein